MPGFARLATTYTLNELADWLATLTLAILVWDATGSALATTALFFASKLVPALVIPAIAAKLDGRPVARVLGRAYLAEAFVFGALALSADAFWLPLVIALALVDGTLAATARAVTRAATQSVLEPAGRLREGNALLNVGFAAMYVGGPALAALLVAALGPAAVLGCAAVVFAVLTGLCGLARDLPAGVPERPPTLEALREGLAYARRHRTLRTLLPGQALVVLFLAVVTPIEVVYVKESLSAGDAGLGILLGAAGAGVVIGSAVFARLRASSLPTLIALATLVMGLGYLALAFAPGLAIACLIAAAVGIGNGIQWVAVVTAVQEATDERFQARVAGLLEAMVTGAPGAAYVLGGTLTALFDPRTAFAVGGVGVLLVLVAAVLVLLRRGTATARVAAPAPEPARP
ncbi:MAG TPA: MFS transporter [Solirubrobacteraceae bacterium]|nr:MFS transporter [Solirubrobacteraceae bacterium]